MSLFRPCPAKPSLSERTPELFTPSLSPLPVPSATRSRLVMSIPETHQSIVSSAAPAKNVLMATPDDQNAATLNQHTIWLILLAR